MYPSYRCMNSHPYQRHQMPAGQYYHPSWEGVPPQTKSDPSIPPFMYEPWPHSYGYSAPIQCHYCCNYNHYLPYYSFRPPFSQFPSPQPGHHCCGGYPAHPELYSAHYAPPPHYTMELPRYEYEKNVPKEYHCCGCPNHRGDLKEDKSVRIEEHEPDLEKSKDESLVPARIQDSQYPIVWVPPGYMEDKGHENMRRPVRKEVEKHHGAPYVKNHQQRSDTGKNDSNAWNGWFPLDRNSIERLMRTGDGILTRDEHGDGKRNRDEEDRGRGYEFPYPIFWIPYERQEKDDAGEENKTTDNKGHTEGAPSNFRVLPTILEHKDDGTMKRDAAAENQGERVKTEVKEKPSNLKTIPVRELGEHVEKASKEEQSCKDVKNVEDNGGGKAAENGNKLRPSSPTKKPKLPPICLRVDSPKKKNGNGSSRSPSPPGDKRQKESNDAYKSAPEISRKGPQDEPRTSPTNADKSKEKQPVRDIEVTETAESATGRKRNEVLNFASSEAKELRAPEDRPTDVEEKAQVETHVVKSDNDESEKNRGVQAQEHEANKNANEAAKPEKKILSGTEAAIIIQSAYRGYEVRRWEPLKKLKEIANIREEAAEIERCIKALETSPGSGLDDKQKVAVGETIMKLLLKLDTIQGLHLSLRDVRKSVAKQLVMLQEKLDSIMSRKSDLPDKEISAVRSVGDVSQVGEEAVKEPGEDDLPDKGISAVSSVGDVSQVGEDGTLKQEELLSSGQFLTMADVVSGPECKETPQTSLDAIEAESGSAPGSLSLTIKAQNASESKVSVSYEEALLKADGSPVEGEPDGSQMGADKASIEIGGPVVEGNSVIDQEPNLLDELPKEVLEGVKTNHSEDTVTDMQVDSSAVNENQGSDLNLLNELPRAGIDEDANDTTLEDAKQNSQREIEREEFDVGISMSKSNDQGIDEVQVEDQKVIAVEPERQESSESSSTLAPFSQQSESVIVEEKNDPVVEHAEDGFPQPPSDMEVSGLQTEDVEKVPKTVEPEVRESVEVTGGRKVDEHQAKESIATDNDELIDKPVVSEHPQADTNPYEDKDETPMKGQDSTEELQEIGDSKRVIEENERLREMLEKLIASGKEQQGVILSLSGKVEDLERKLARRKKTKTKRPRVVLRAPSCAKPSKNNFQERAMGLAS